MRLDLEMNWNGAFVYGWLAILAILGLYEGYALIWGKAEPPLTQVVCRYSPWWLTLSFLGWLFYHFAKRYADAAYIAHLKTGK